MKIIKTKIVSNEKIAPRFYRMSIESASLSRAARPGQFVEVRCSQGFDPLLRRPLGVHRIRRSGIDILYEVVGKGTALLSEMVPGQILDVLGPLGNGFDVARSELSIIVAGGIGAAPLLALAEEVVDRNSLLVNRKKIKPIVFIGAKSKTHILCDGEFKRLGCTVKVATEDGSKGHKGLVTDLLKNLLRKTNDERRLSAEALAKAETTIYACGPTPMLRAVSKMAGDYSIPCQVSLEERMACGAGVCLGCPVKVKTKNDKRKTNDEYKMVCKDGPVFDSEDIVW